MLLLFFFSYAGPLSEIALREADKHGFTQAIGSGRLRHMRNWPKEYADWADGDARHIGNQKFATIGRGDAGKQIIASDDIKACLNDQWPKELHNPIRSLIGSSVTIFGKSTRRTADTAASRTEALHSEFTKTLDKWLDKYSDLEDKFSNCPFRPGPLSVPFCHLFTYFVCCQEAAQR